MSPCLLCSPTHSSVYCHCQVISFYLRLLPQSQHSLLLERLRPAMTNNIELNLRYADLSTHMQTFWVCDGRGLMKTVEPHHLLVAVSIAVSFLRSLDKELQDGNLQQVKYSTRILINNVPRNLSAWKLWVNHNVKKNIRLWITTGTEVCVCAHVCVCVHACVGRAIAVEAELHQTSEVSHSFS